MKRTQDIKLSQDARHLVALLSGHAAKLGVLTEAEWLQLINLAKKNGVSQMLYTALKTQCVPVPSVIAEHIRTIHLSSAVYSTKMFHELDNVLKTFEDADITVVPVKGAWLSETVYSNIALRGMSDIDLWVEKTEKDKARKAIESQGYVANFSRKDRPEALRDQILGEIQYFKSGFPMVELHWNIFRGEWLRHIAKIDEKIIWNRTHFYKSNKVRQLSAEDAIIHLCIHLAVNHQMSMSGLRTMIDLDVARKKLNIDWQIVAHRAKDWRVATSMWLALSMLEKLFGDSEKQLPLKELQPSLLHRWLLRLFVSPQSLCDGLDIRESPKRFIFLFALLDKPADAFMLLWRAIVPDPAWFTLRYGLQEAPRWRVLVQRLWHPFRIILYNKI